MKINQNPRVLGGNEKTCIFDENRPAIFADVPTLPPGTESPTYFSLHSKIVTKDEPKYSVPTLPPGTESPTYFSLHCRVSIWDAPYDSGYGLHLAK